MKVLPKRACGKVIGREDGTSIFFAVALIVLLIFTGLAYMKWGADEGYEATFETHKLQAYYAAHAGIMDLGMKDLRALKAYDIPADPIYLGQTDVTTEAQQNVARADVWRIPDINEQGVAAADFNYIDFYSIGTVNFRDYDGKMVQVQDSLEMKVKLLGLQNYFYLTDHEVTPFGEVIKFWHEDTLEGWVHSNDTIAIMENPVFYDRVTTTAPVFWQGPGFNPQFVNYDPVFNYKEIYLPTEASEIRNAAAASGTFFENPNGMYAHRLEFKDNQGWVMYRWPMGLPWDSTAVLTTGPVPNWLAIFVDGYLELEGVVRGQVTVGAHGHPDKNGYLGWHCIRLMDDIRYWFANPVNGSFNDTTGGFTDILGIVSESNITIADSWENGRHAQERGSDIIITAAMLALGDDDPDPFNPFMGSFSFQDQNEPPPIPTIWEFYDGTYYSPTPPNNDERGDIHLWGAVTQRRRGYVHRSNHAGTGYGKDYHWDDRLNQMAPPYFPAATDAEGNAFFEILSWGNR